MIGNSHTKGMTPVNAKKVICNKIGRIFKSINDAAEYIKINGNTLSAMLRGESPNKTTMEYYYV